MIEKPQSIYYKIVNLDRALEGIIKTWQMKNM